jgi:predicted alpha/beta hydrolase family esterase
VVLVAHSLGCMLTAAWASHSQHTARVRGALLVAPPDLDRDDMPPQVTTWRPVPRQRLPFPATLVFSSDDPYCGADRATRFAADWGAVPLPIGPRGHVNDASGLGDWPEGLACLAAWGVAPGARA